MKDDLDLEQELVSMCWLRAFGGPRGRLARCVPKLTVLWSDAPGGWPGEADKDGWAITLRIGPHSDSVEIRETLLHELTHLCRPECWHHRAQFRRTLAAAALERWGIDPGCLNPATCSTGELDSALTEALLRAEGRLGVLGAAWGLVVRTLGKERAA